MTAKEIRDITGLTRAAFSRQYGIPIRTLENWESDTNKAPEWAMNLLERAVKQDFGPKLDAEHQFGMEVKDEGDYYYIHSYSVWQDVPDREWKVAKSELTEDVWNDPEALGKLELDVIDGAVEGAVKWRGKWFTTGWIRELQAKYQDVNWRRYAR